MRVFVYYNLHRKTLSVRAEQGSLRGLVIAHARAVQLLDAKFTVSQAGRQRVLRERAKNVHAGVKGELVGIDVIEWLRAGLEAAQVGQVAEALNADDAKVCRVTYDPYRYESFVERGSERPVHEASRVDIVDKDIRCLA